MCALSLEKARDQSHRFRMYKDILFIVPQRNQVSHRLFNITHTHIHTQHVGSERLYSFHAYYSNVYNPEVYSKLLKRYQFFIAALGLTTRDANTTHIFFLLPPHSLV